MEIVRRNSKILFWIVPVIALLYYFPTPASGQPYPNKPISIYCGSEAGATLDLTARALCSGAEKILGVPLVVENKAGGVGTIAASLLANKKPDGYSLGIISTGALNVRPLLLTLSYNPLKDFTYILQYSRFIGSLCVLSESPLKTIDEFISYAKAHPGLSYGSPAMYGQNHITIELFARCKGLTFKHVPHKGGAPANTALLGKHTDFVAGSGGSIAYIKQGLFRMLLVTNTGKRDPHFPNVPTLKELGCEDAPASGYLVMGPKGIPDALCKKLGESFKKVAESPDFQRLLENYDLPYDYKDRGQLEEMIPAEYEMYKEFLRRVGAKQKGS